MPSPFPGMDPFIEAEHFGALHLSMIAYSQEVLQGRLPEGYYATTSERVWIDTSKRRIEPDIEIKRSATKRSGRSFGSGGVVATLTRPVIVTIPHDERVETFLEIYKKRGDKKRLVCSIEMLSLTNKTPGEKGAKLYRRKQREIMRRKVHLVEIDFLRAGTHATAVDLDWAKEETGDFDYHVCCRRFNRFEDFEVYPIQLPEPLPTIAIPLLPADGDVSLDLQAVFTRAYDAGPYRRAIEYSRDEVQPTLTAAENYWMRGVLRKAGINRRRT
ncbi:MAG: DUF4058 family protein [Planctomycetes bacterium]|nr:DUF4058 family protein [Planctomycetota bacterium]